MDNVKLKTDECLICFEECKINEAIYCDICKKFCHKNCFQYWQKNKKSKYQKTQCIHCLSKKCLKKKRYMICCYVGVFI